MKIAAIIVAAGKGERAGTSLPKQYVALAGKPVLAHSALALSSHPQITRTVVVIAEGQQEFANTALAGLRIDRIVVGGHSAGAYLAAMLAFAPEFLKAAGDKPEALCGFVGLEGIYDLQELATRFPSYREDFLPG